MKIIALATRHIDIASVQCTSLSAIATGGLRGRPESFLLAVDPSGSWAIYYQAGSAMECSSPLAHLSTATY